MHSTAMPFRVLLMPPPTPPPTPQENPANLQLC